jgi:transcriptional regulator with GAF, ATPase, and Fis domain
LRERREDIPILAQHYLDYYNKKIGKQVDKILPETMQAFLEYSWPGNVREIMNVIEQAVITSHGAALQVDFLESTGKNVSGSRHLEDIERDHIVKTLKQAAWRIKGNKGGAALLGINPSTLRSRMKKLGIKRPDQNP